MKKNSLFGPFYFQNQLILARQYEKLPLPREGLAPNNDPKNCSENITAAPAARCCMQYLFLKLSLWSVSQFGFFQFLFKMKYKLLNIYYLQIYNQKNARVKSSVKKYQTKYLQTNLSMKQNSFLKKTFCKQQ